MLNAVGRLVVMDNAGVVITRYSTYSNYNSAAVGV